MVRQQNVGKFARVGKSCASVPGGRGDRERLGPFRRANKKQKYASLLFLVILRLLNKQ